MSSRPKSIDRIINFSLRAHELARDLNLHSVMRGLEMTIVLAEAEAANRTPNPLSRSADL